MRAYDGAPCIDYDGVRHTDSQVLADPASREMADYCDAELREKMATWEAEAKAMLANSSTNSAVGVGGGEEGGGNVDSSSKSSRNEYEDAYEQTTAGEAEDSSHVGYEAALAPYPAALANT